jgi:predicted aspartyl protease
MFPDTGATGTIIPYRVAEEVGFAKPAHHMTVEYGDGHRKELEAASIVIRIGGRETVDTILLSDVGEPVLGVFTLEVLGFKVNPESGKIEPSRSWIARA